VHVELGSALEEIVVVYHGPVESYGFHALEMGQCLVERRKGFETGVAAVQALRGDRLWEAWERGDHWSGALQTAALERAGGQDEPPRAFYERRQAQRAAAVVEPEIQPGIEMVEPVAFVVQYRDGVQLTVILLPEYTRGAGVAARIAGETEPLAIRFGGYKLEHFSKLVWHIEELVRTGQPTYPVERTLLTTGMLDAAMTSRFEGGRRIETPHLDVTYQPAQFGWQSTVPWPR
jgi:hypothetical protein